MKVYEHPDEMSGESRQRRWLVSEYDSSHRFYDFRENPELIPTVLEDFVPFADQPSVQEFFKMLANINGAESFFETNDSAFIGPHPNTATQVSSRSLEIRGRVMFYYREIPLNTRRPYIEWLEDGVHFYLSQLTPELDEGVVGTSIMKMHMPELGSEHAPAQGFELCLHFWSWGDTEAEAWANLHVVISNIQHTLAALSVGTAQKRYLLPAGG